VNTVPTNSRPACAVEGVKEAGKVLVSLLFLAGLGWIALRVGNETIRMLGGGIIYITAIVTAGPVTVALTAFDISNEELIILSIVFIIPYWILLGTVGGLLQEAQKGQNASRRKKYTRWTIEVLAAVMAIAFFWVTAQTLGHSDRPVRSRIINNLKQMDLAKRQLASDRDLPDYYVPTLEELSHYFQLQTNYYNEPLAPVRYVVDSITNKPYAVLYADWRFPRRSFQEGHTLTNGTIFRLP